MSIDDAVHGRQTDTAAFEFVGAVEALKRSKQFLRVIHIESHAVVTDEINIFRGTGLVSDFDLGGFFIARELDRVG